MSPKKAAHAHSELTSKTKFEPQGLVDPAFALLFGFHVVGIAAYVGYIYSSGGLSSAMATLSSDDTVALLQGDFARGKANPQAASMVLIGMSFALSIAYACSWMMLLQSFPKQMVYGSMYIMAGFMFLCGVLCLAGGAIIAGLLNMLFGSILLCVTCCLRQQLEFTAKIVDAVSTVYSGHKSIFLVAILMIMVSIMWQALSLTSMLPTAAAQAEHDRLAEEAEARGEEPPPNTATGPTFLLLLSFYWGVQVFSNILHVSCSGVIARYYFDKQVDSAVARSTGQAWTSYLGPIAFGSLLIAIIQTLKAIAEQAAKKDDRGGRRGGNGAEALIACVAVCILGCLERLMEIFNNFCFIIVAIYGTTFCGAGQEVLRLFSQPHGFKTIIAWNYVGIVCFVGNLVGGILVACITGLMGAAMLLPSAYISGCSFAAFLIGFCIMMVVARVMESGCDTLIVCYVEEPEKCKTSAPEVYQAFGERKRLGHH